MFKKLLIVGFHSENPKVKVILVGQLADSPRQ